MGAVAELRSIDSGPIRRALENLQRKVDNDKGDGATAGNALGVVAKGSFVGGDAWPLPSGVDLRITNDLAFTSVVGRRYRMWLQVRATAPTSGSGLNFVPHGSGLGTNSFDIWMRAGSEYNGVNFQALFDGTGVASNYWWGATSPTATNLWFDTMSTFYIEDVGPNQSPALPVPATSPPWTPHTLQNGWEPYSTVDQAPRYRKIGDIVYCEGLAKNGMLNGTNAMFTLPVGFRPPKTLHFLQITSGGPQRMIVDSNGTAVGLGGPADQGWYSCNFSFSTTP